MLVLDNEDLRAGLRAPGRSPDHSSDATDSTSAAQSINLVEPMTRSTPRRIPSNANDLHTYSHVVRERSLARNPAIVKSVTDDDDDDHEDPHDAFLSRVRSKSGTDTVRYVRERRLSIGNEIKNAAQRSLRRSGVRMFQRALRRSRWRRRGRARGSLASRTRDRSFPVSPIVIPIEPPTRFAAMGMLAAGELPRTAAVITLEKA